MKDFDDSLSVEEVENLCVKVEEWYAKRGKQTISLFWLAKSILKRLMNDLDYYINVEGTKGFGKSNMILLLSLIMCRYSGKWRNKLTGKIVKVYPRLNPLPEPWEHIEQGFQFSKNMSFLDNTEELKKKFYSLDKYMPFIVDEGSKNLHKYQWATKLQFMLVSMSDSISKDNEVIFYEGDELKRMTIEEMYKKYGENPKNIYVYTADKFKMYLKPLKYILQRPIRKPQKRMFKITTRFNKETIVTEDHSLYKYSHGAMKEVSPLNLKIGDNLIMPLNLPSKETITKDNIDMQLYGAWLADGSYASCGKGKTKGVIRLSGFEHKSIINKVCNKYQINYSKCKKPSDININSVELVKQMINLGFIGHSDTKRVPSWVFNTSKENKLSFLKGYFTGDGTINFEGQVKVSSINKELIRDIQILLQMCGIPSLYFKDKSINKFKDKITHRVYSNNTHNHSLTISMTFSDKTIHLFEDCKKNYQILKNHKPCRLMNKPNSERFIKNDCVCVAVKKIEEIDNYEGNVYDLEVEGIHRFISNDLLHENTERYQNKAFFVCFPNFKELNSTFRNDRINMRLYLFNKNVSEKFSQTIISIRDVNRHVADKWHTDENAKQFEYFLRKVPVAQRAAHHILYAESKLAGYAGNFDVPSLQELAPRIWEIYMHYKLSNAQKNRDADDLQDDRENKTTLKWKLNTFKLITFIKEKFQGVTNAQIGELLGSNALLVSRVVNDPEHKAREQEILEKIKSVEI